MVRFTSSTLVLLAAIGSSLAKQKSVLVGFSNMDAYNEVVQRATAPGASTSSNVAEPKMFRRPLHVGRKSERRGRGAGRKLPGRNGYDGNTPDPTEPEPEMTIGYTKVDYTNDADIDKEIEALGKIHNVTVAERNGEVKALGLSTNGKEGKENKGGILRGQVGRVLAESTLWGMGMVNITQFWPGGSQEVTPQNEVKICIIDTGYDLGHEDLPTTSDHGVTGYSPSSYSGVWDVDGNGHGTHVAGTIGAIGSNNIGVAGVLSDPSKFKFRIGKGLEDNGSGTNDGVIECIEDCVTSGADVISMSLRSFYNSALVESACEAAYDDGVLVVAAAGNHGLNGGSRYAYPASYSAVMSVASVRKGDGPGSDTYGKYSNFSPFNDQVEIAAPGSVILSTLPNDKYESYSGTSMATPHVSGVAAWLMSLFNCEANQIRNAMLNSAREPPRDDDGWDDDYGHGIVDAGAAFSLLSSAGCVGAGGLSPSEMGELPSEIVQGGQFQKDIGCTADHHCYIGASFGPRFCNTDLSPNKCASCTICDDIETPWMNNNNVDCAVNNEDRMNKRCNKDAKWTQEGYCRLSCYESGNGYPGDVCCDTAPPPSPTLQPSRSRNPTSCTICDDIETPWMNNNNVDCAVNNEDRMNKRCNKDAKWTQEGYCRLSCYESGNGYPGDVCCASCTICDDIESPWMNNNNVDCAVNNGVILNTKCNKDAKWTQEGWCRLSCYESGNGYPGDVCCDESGS